LGFRVLGAAAGTVGCLAAAEVVKLLSGAGAPLAGRLLYGDLWEMDFQTLVVRRVAACPDCSAGVDSAGVDSAGVDSAGVESDRVR
jgi:molybdopterin/thiamine biosynthesis adenylyltransferase